MSRIAVVLLGTLLGGTALAEEPAPLDRYAALTSVVVKCRAGASEIVVCGRRAADKWRVPFLGYDAGDPRGEDISGERNRLASEPKLACGLGAFLSGCGMVGVSVSTRFDGSALRPRPLAD